jgi:hypothetical protein
VSLGVDYSFGTPNPAALKAAGVEFVGRYLSTPGNPKNLTKTECLLLRTGGFKIVTVFETTANRALRGTVAGKADARSARAQLVALGAPVDAPVYFAVDFDATEAEQTSINAYLNAAASVLGRNRVGVYGGYWPVKRALNAGVCKYAWQTFAWSGGHWDPRAHIRQTRNGQRLAGVTVDLDESRQPDYGQWFSTPVPVPRPKPTPPIVFPADDTFWTWLRWRTGTGEFAVYGPRAQQVRPNVPQRIPAAWWRALSFYLKNRPSA